VSEVETVLTGDLSSEDLGKFEGELVEIRGLDWLADIHRCLYVGLLQDVGFVGVTCPYDL
jgi:hypothetical protein